MSAPLSAEAGKDTFARLGYLRFPFDRSLAAWAAYAALSIEPTLADPAHDHWWRHQRTWFVGVDALPNDDQGRLPGGPPLQGAAIDFIRHALGFGGPWHRGQLSVCFPGYPRRDETETEQQHNYRITWDAAHVDGLKAEGKARRRHLREPHLFILGIPLNDVAQDASPFVVWEGSHHIMQRMFQKAFSGLPLAKWGDVDVTEVYQEARRQVFATCRRRLLPARPGEAYVAHRFALHGVAPWTVTPTTPQSGARRAIVYFRPPADSI